MRNPFGPDDEYVFTFPVCGLWRTDRPWPVVVTAVGSDYLPLFTDLDAALTFLDRSGIGVARPLVLPTPAAVAEFLTFAASHPLLRVMVDPLDGGPGWRRVFDIRGLIQRFRAGRR
jgi:hypothetical protein